MPIRVHPLHVLIIAAVLLVVTDIADASTSGIGNYRQLRDALFDGVRVTALFSPALCEATGTTAQPNGNGPAVEGGFAIDSFLEVADNYIAFSDRHFTVRPSGMPTLELMQYRVMPNQDATVAVRALSPFTYRPLAEEKHYRCRVGVGLRFR